MKNMLPEIHYKTIPYKKMRYSTEGDYFKKGKKMEFRVSEFGNETIEMIIFIHELWEYLRTKQAGIKIEDIDKFDIESGLEDPGLSKDAPYRQQHSESVQLERLMCKMSNIKYEDYYNYKHI